MNPSRRRMPLCALSAALVLSTLCRPSVFAQIDEPPAERPGLHPLHVWDDQPDWITSLVFLKDGRHFCAGTYEQLAGFRRTFATVSHPNR